MQLKESLSGALRRLFSRTGSTREEEHSESLPDNLEAHSEPTENEKKPTMTETVLRKVRKKLDKELGGTKNFEAVTVSFYVDILIDNAIAEAERVPGKSVDEYLRMSCSTWKEYSIQGLAVTPSYEIPSRVLKPGELRRLSDSGELPARVEGKTWHEVQGDYLEKAYEKIKSLTNKI